MASPSGSTHLPVPIISSHCRRSWPKHPAARRVTYHSLATALTHHYPCDAHLAGYSVPTWPYRLSSGALFPEATSHLPDGIAMALAVFDIDGHAQVDITAWWHAERRKLGALQARHAGIYTYRTRGGYRALGILPDPIILHTAEDAEAWHQCYLGWVAYLQRAFEIGADPACKDWTRLYRLPHATREERGRPEDWETLGDPRHIGLWHCAPTAEDRALAQTLSRRKTAADRAPRRVGNWSDPSQGAGHGLLYHAFRARGWLGDEIEVGKWAVLCPWETSHTKGGKWDSSTVLWAPGPGEDVGWWFCSHTHCQSRDLRDVLGLFSLAELARARPAAGLITRTVQGLRLSHTRGKLRLVPAKEVLAWRR